MSTDRNCEQCGGTGADAKKTAAMYRRESSSSGCVRCWNCNGNGLDPAKFFRWSEPKKDSDAQP